MVSPQRELDRFLFDKKKKKIGVKQDKSLRPFVKGSECPAD
jgi:hypothetical protein